jgi:signal transduction histidine kinase
MGDRSQLIQVFLNLMENALQAKPTCMTVTTHIETEFSLRTDHSDPTKFVTVDIRDNGTGIDEEDLPDIFSPFFTRKHRGTGLGLAICDRTIKEHGGRLGVESRLGEGSVFKVSLPAQQG